MYYRLTAYMSITNQPIFKNFVLSDCRKAKLYSKMLVVLWFHDDFVIAYSWSEWPSGLYSLHQVTEVKLGRVKSNSGLVASKA